MTTLGIFPINKVDATFISKTGKLPPGAIYLKSLILYCTNIDADNLAASISNLGIPIVFPCLSKKSFPNPQITSNQGAGIVTILTGINDINYTNYQYAVNPPFDINITQTYNSLETIDFNVNNYTSDVGSFALHGFTIYPSPDSYSTTITFTTGTQSNRLSWFIYTGGLNCLLKGTKILTPIGEVLIESLKIGDTVLTYDNRSVKVTGVYSSLSNADEHLYVIRKNVVSDGIPNSDLFLSGGHRVRINGKLYHPFHNKTDLIEKYNESTMKIVPFYHIILENYLTDYLVANGLEVESMSDGKTPSHSQWDCDGEQCKLLIEK